jgi:hypothetical protein
LSQSGPWRLVWHAKNIIPPEFSESQLHRPGRKDFRGVLAENNSIVFGRSRGVKVQNLLAAPIRLARSQIFKTKL